MVTKVTFNDKMGTRGRKCHYGVVYAGKAYAKEEAEKLKLAVFRELSYERRGQWSNSTWEVTTKSAKPFVFMQPFEGWVTDLQTCIQEVKKSCTEYIGVELTDEEAEAAFSSCCPNTYKKCKDNDVFESELI